MGNAFKLFVTGEEIVDTLKVEEIKPKLKDSTFNNEMNFYGNEPSVEKMVDEEAKLDTKTKVNPQDEEQVMKVKTAGWKAKDQKQV